MTEIRDLHPDIEKEETPVLHARMDTIIQSAPNGNTRELSDDDLIELLCISRALRKRAASPGGARKPRPKAAKGQESLDDFA